jgi:hypothetical protein
LEFGTTAVPDGEVELVLLAPVVEALLVEEPVVVVPLDAAVAVGAAELAVVVFAADEITEESDD